MPRLEVNNGFSQDIPGLGKISPFTDLSPKRISKCVPNVLRKEYGFNEAHVSCDPMLINGIWVGNCRIRGEQNFFKIFK
jgi:hypothetical protein